MTDKPWRVVQPSGMTWMLKFKTEAAAWSRLVSATCPPGTREDTPGIRQVLIAEGWRVRNITEVTS